MTLDIRPVRQAELPAYIDALSTGFLERYDSTAIAAEVEPVWDLERTWGAFDEGRVCGTFRSWATEITTPGGERLPASAVAAVTVLPTHRRRGILRGMAAAEHAAARERGEAVSILWASEYPIYGRLGYGPACRVATWTVDVERTVVVPPRTGQVELVAADETTRDALRSVFEAWRERQPGEIRRRDFTWDQALGLRPTAWGDDWKGFVALHRDDAGLVDGYARYHVDQRWEERQPRNVLVLDELHALDDAANASLWRFLSEIDLVSTIRAERRSPADRLPWLLSNGRAAVTADVGDAIWVRLLDVPRALAARSYEREGSVVLGIIDPEAPGGEVKVLLDAGPDGARSELTARSPDLTIDIAAAGAAWLGGTPLRHAVLAKGVDEHRPDALAEADRLFRTLDEPWCSTFF